MNGAAAKILVVDDEAIARANLARVLAHDGHETAQAGLGEAVTAVAHAQHGLGGGRGDRRDHRRNRFRSNGRGARGRLRG